MKSSRCIALAIAALVASPVTSAAAAGLRSDRHLCHGYRITLLGSRDKDTLQGTDGRDVIAGLGGDDRIVGNDGNDILCGNKGKDLIDGRYGRDEIYAGGGNDKLFGGPGVDLLDGGSQSDTFDGEDGRDSMIGRAGRDLFRASSGGAWIFGGRGADIARGGPARDRYYLAAGDDYADGGTGEDLVSYRFSTSLVSVDLASNRSTGDGIDDLYGIEHIEGSQAGDEIEGDALANEISGLGGNDRISGGEGPDRIDGGAGDDELGGSGDGDTITFATSPNGVDIDLVTGKAKGYGSDNASSFEDITGSPYEDELRGDNGPNIIEAWTDAVDGLGGDDTIYGGTGDAGPGDDTCWNSGVTHCEHIGVIDFARSPAITHPLPNQELSRLAAIRGGTRDGLSPPFPSDAKVFVSLRRLTADGCFFWVAGGETTERACERPLWHRAKGSTDRWRFSIRGSVPPGFYEALVSFVVRGVRIVGDPAEFTVTS